jgi:hypothetical protein
MFGNQSYSSSHSASTRDVRRGIEAGENKIREHFQGVPILRGTFGDFAEFVAQGACVAACGGVDARESESRRSSRRVHKFATPLVRRVARPVSYLSRKCNSRRAWPSKNLFAWRGAALLHLGQLDIEERQNGVADGGLKLA